MLRLRALAPLLTLMMLQGGVGCGQPAPPLAEATAVPGVEGATALALGLRHSCAILEDGAVRCWGSNQGGQLGAGSKGERHGEKQPPRDVLREDGAPLRGATSITADGDHACANLDGGEVLCWGINQEGVLGVALGSPSITSCSSSLYTGPCLLAATPVEALSGSSEVALGSSRAFDDTEVPEPVSPEDPEDPETIALGGRLYGVLADPERRARGWSWNARQAPDELGELRLPSGAPLSGVRRLSAGPSHVCALLGDGGVFCSGMLVDRNWSNELVEMRFERADRVAGLEGIVDIASSADHVCAAREDGKVLCLGFAGRSQLGIHRHDLDDPDPYGVALATPVVVEGVEDAVAVIAGHWFSCARRRDGKVLCWGNNSASQLGRPDVGLDSEKPVLVAGLPGPVEAIAAGDAHACAIGEDGAVYCWGKNDGGQAGPIAEAPSEGGATAHHGAR